MGTFGAAHGWGICHTYLTMMKPGTVIVYLKKIQKIYRSRGTPPDFCWHQHFFTGNQQIFLYQETQIWAAFWLQILLAFLESLKICLINMVTILLMSAKMATPDLLKITKFWNEGYDVIISVDEVINKILSRDSNFIAFMWPKFGNCSISKREVMTTSIL